MLDETGVNVHMQAGDTDLANKFVGFLLKADSISCQSSLKEQP